jgi:hypothetical protein
MKSTRLGRAHPLAARNSFRERFTPEPQADALFFVRGRRT